MNRWLPLLPLLNLATASCFNATSEGNDESDDTDSPNAESSTGAGSSEQAEDSAAPDPGTPTTTTSSSSTTAGEPDPETSEGGGTGPAPACAPGQACLGVPDGWSGPFIPELGDAGQCDDASFPAAFAGTTPVWNGDCSCDCSTATIESCTMEFLVGGDADTCSDNTEVGDTCTSNLQGGPITCENSRDGCFATQGERVFFRSAHTCSGGTGSLVEPSWASGFRLCNPDAVVSTPCAEGQCAQPGQALCIYAPGELDTCPGSFPNLASGHQGFSEPEVACECSCEDPAQCSYLTWHEAGICTGQGGDDDPSCSPREGSVEFLNDFAQTPQGCEATANQPGPPDFPLADPITLCCTIAL